MAEKRFINPVELARPGSYTPAVVTHGGRTIYVAGQVSQNEKGEVVGKGDLLAQQPVGLDGRTGC